jgi:hypothetical protein
VIALAIALAAANVVLTGFVVTCGVWMRSDKREFSAVVDNLDGQRKLVAEYKHKADTEHAAHTVTTAQLATERNLRAVAEAQRNEAMRRSRAYLAQSMSHATESEINEVRAGLFASVLSLVPTPPAEGAGADDPDGLIAFSDMRPPEPS